MNTNPKAKRILVYGDSLPWGLIPGSKTFERLSSDNRWPGKLQTELGDEYEVIEENLCARTIDSDDLRPGFEGRNGSTSLITCLDSHDPLDIIVVALGLNEIKSIFEWTPEQVADKMKVMLETIINRKPNFHEVKPRIILLAPPIVDEGEAANYWGELWVGSGDKSRALANQFARIAGKLGAECLNTAAFVSPGVDGVHLDVEGHEIMAEKLAEVIKAG